MNTENQEIHIHGLVQGLVVGTGNSVTLVYQSGEKRTVPFLAPPQPPYDLIGRDDLLRDLKAKLLEGKNLALSALNGLPGIGRTALAVALAYDPQVLSHFSDGILWAGLGRDASETNVLSILSLWGTALGVPPNEMEKLPDVKARRERIQATIGQRSILLVIDDAWKIELAWQLKVGGPNCAYLLTTRVPEVATRYAHEAHEVRNEMINSKSGEKYAFLKRKNTWIPHKGGIYEQYRRFDGGHPDLFALGSLDPLVVWRGGAHHRASAQARRLDQTQ